MAIRNYLKELKDIQALPKKGSVLDLGCGDGRYSKPFHDAGWKCVLVDKDKVLLNIAKKNNPKAKFYAGDVAEFLKSVKGKYDIVIIDNVLPFLPEAPDRIVALIHNHLNKGGVIISSLFGEKDPWNPSPGISFHSKKYVVEAFSNLYEPISSHEIEAWKPLMNGQPKFWHRFEFIGRKI